MKYFLCLVILVGCNQTLSTALTPEERLEKMVAIHIERDKKEGVFKSDANSKENFGNVVYQFNLGVEKEFNDIIFFGKDDEKISRALADYRFLKNENEKILARRKIYEYYITSGKYHRTSDLVQCHQDHITIMPLKSEQSVACYNDEKTTGPINYTSHSALELQTAVNESIKVINEMARSQSKTIHVFFHF